jgi:hypothetical protein
MHTKYKPIVPNECQDNILYEKPAQSVINVVKAEKASRETFKKELNMEKGKVLVEMKIKFVDHLKVE